MSITNQDYRRIGLNDQHHNLSPTQIWREPGSQYAFSCFHTSNIAKTLHHTLLILLIEYFSPFMFTM